MPRARLVACLGLALGLALPACFLAPRGRFTAESRTDPACRAAILGALEAFPRDLGLGFSVDDADVDALLRSDALEKGYARDAVRFTVDFGLDVREGGVCRLRIWSMTERRPGSTSTRSGDFGGVDVGACRCETAK